MIAFNCTFAADVIAFVWIRDHLVCHTRPVPFGNSPSSTDGSPEYPLPVKKGQVDPVVVHVYNTGANKTSAISIQWVRPPPDSYLSCSLAPVHISSCCRQAELDAPMKKGSAPPTVPIPTPNLSPALPASEIQRRSLQDALKTGWSTWSAYLLLLPMHSYILCTAGLTTCSASHDSPTRLRSPLLYARYLQGIASSRRISRTGHC
jgi:hypothetical protein